MKRLQERGASYFILDLRDNLGGLVQAGIEIAKLFLNEGEKVIDTVGKDSQYQNTIVADSAPLVKAPVIVLVNNKTASASEIVASALHDNCRAVLVGERTFGKMKTPLEPLLSRPYMHLVSQGEITKGGSFYLRHRKLISFFGPASVNRTSNHYCINKNS